MNITAFNTTHFKAILVISFILVANLCVAQTTAFSENAQPATSTATVESPSATSSTNTVFSASAQLATSTANFKRGLSTAGFWETDTHRSGGSFEIGFPLLKEKNVFVLRDYFIVSGYGWYSSNAEISIGNKLQIGGKYPTVDFNIISYGFFQVDASYLFGEDASFGCWIGGGGGFEFQFAPKNSFVVEYGGRGLIKKSLGTPFLTLGYRQYY